MSRNSAEQIKGKTSKAEFFLKKRRNCAACEIKPSKASKASKAGVTQGTACAQQESIN